MLLRTLFKSFVAVLMIVTFAILTCIVCSSLMYSTNEVGDFRIYAGQSSNTRFGMYYREDESHSVFANMGEIWWWCLQARARIHPRPSRPSPADATVERAT